MLTARKDKFVGGRSLVRASPGGTKSMVAFAHYHCKPRREFATSRRASASFPSRKGAAASSAAPRSRPERRVLSAIGHEQRQFIPAPLA